MRKVDQKSVRMPPTVPRIISFNSVNISKRRTRKMRNTLKRRRTRKANMSVALWLPLPEMLAIARAVSSNARTTRVVSQMFGTKSSARQKKRAQPAMRSFNARSTANSNAKQPSMATQPFHCGRRSVLTPRSSVFATMATPTAESRTQSRRSNVLRLCWLEALLLTGLMPNDPWIISNVRKAGAAESSSSLSTTKVLLRPMSFDGVLFGELNDIALFGLASCSPPQHKSLLSPRT
mmetsp:Transcript_106390/g.297899  ORF Transcript_106390/g.297899 Transcript_106390/m.297899 type:complete len:235 (-) Transcript_106390:321-1025(-)